VTETETQIGRRIRTVHHLTGRTRLRITPAPLTDKEAQAVADTFAKVPGVKAVTVDARAGSVLATHEPQIEPASLEQALVAAIFSSGEPLPAATTSALARAVAHLFHEINRDILTSTGGRLDAATLATFGFLGAGALQVAVDTHIGPPPWFNLAWWGFRTFVTLEKDAIRAADDDDDDDNGDAEY
jgi:hypothetical protein